MKKPTAKGTPVYQRQHSRGLTLPQLNAVDLLASGKTDKETAELLNLSRVCVTKWRLYDPVFQAALNVRRAEVWSVGATRLQSLIPKALDVLAGEFDNPDSPNRLKAAIELLRLVPLSLPSPGPIDPEVIVRRIVEERRERLRQERERHTADKHDELLGIVNHLTPMPSADELTAAVWRELDARLAEPDAGDTPTPAG